MPVFERQGNGQSAFTTTMCHHSGIEMTTETLLISGMSCNHCVHAVRMALTHVSDVHIRKIKVGSATISFPPERRSRILRAIEDEGYRVRDP